jgi:hypothetical protein
VTDVEIAAGPELDAQIAEKVMAWHLEDEYFWVNATAIVAYATDEPPFSGGRGPRFSPSTDIAHAWKVVEFIKRERGWRVSLVSSVDGGEWTCAFFGTGNPLLGGAGSTSAKSAPLAICRAALASLTI